MSGFADLRDFQRTHRQWVEQGLENGLALRDGRWSEAIAVGSRAFVETVKDQLGFKAAHRGVIEKDESYSLREPGEAYGLKVAAERPATRAENTILWDESLDART